jgi:hypothetical protein
MAMVVVIEAHAGDCDPFASRNHRRMADGCDQIAMTPCVHLQHSKAVLSVVEGDPFPVNGGVKSDQRAARK